MKTEVAKPATGEKTIIKSVEERLVVQGVRRSLHPLQIAAGDKENLVGAGRLGDMPSSKERIVVNPPSKPSDVVSVKKQKTSQNPDTRGITVEDLTSDEPPPTTSSYWQLLCQNQRAALEKAQDENRELKERVKLLEEENEQCRVLLEETKALVDTLKEMLYDPNDDSCGEE